MPQIYSENVCATSGNAGVISVHYQLFLSFVFLCKKGGVSQDIKNYSVGFAIEKCWEMLLYTHNLSLMYASSVYQF